MEILEITKERPILFSTPMVQAILAGRKTQTRRMVKFGKHLPNSEDQPLSTHECGSVFHFWGNGETVCPYGQPGDILWVRETWCKGTPPWDGDGPTPPLRYYYKADSDWQDTDWHHWDKDGPQDSPIWKPSIHMPRAACRLRLEITDVRVERLQDISEEDAKAEGVEIVNVCNLDDPNDTIRYRDYRYKDKFDDKARLWHGAKRSFETLWQSINGEESWNKDPYVWVVGFRKID